MYALSLIKVKGKNDGISLIPQSDVRKLLSSIYTKTSLNFTIITKEKTNENTNNNERILLQRIFLIDKLIIMK